MKQNEVPVAPVGQGSYDQPRRVSKVFIAVPDLRVNHLHHHVKHLWLTLLLLKDFNFKEEEVKLSKIIMVNFSLIQIFHLTRITNRNDNHDNY